MAFLPVVHWGTLMSNVLRRIPLAALLDPSADLARGSGVDRLGEVGDAAGDPAMAIVGIDKGLTVALAGVGQIAIQDPRTKEWSRLNVGRRPIDLLADPERGLVYVADTFGDAVVVVDPDEPSVGRRIALGPEPVLTAADRGERLFFDARLSHDGWMSCHSCHTDGHTNGLLNDNLGDGSYGAPKRVVSLRGVGQTGPWAWNGAINVLTDQITKSVRTTIYIYYLGNTFNFFGEYHSVVMKDLKGNLSEDSYNLTALTAELSVNLNLANKPFKPYVRYDFTDFEENHPYYGVRVEDGMAFKGYVPVFNALMVGVSYDLSAFNRVKLEYVKHFDGSRREHGITVQTAFGF